MIRRLHRLTQRLKLGNGYEHVSRMFGKREKLKKESITFNDYPKSLGMAVK